MTAERRFMKAVHRLDGSNFELDPQQIARTNETHVVVPIVWLIVVVEALGEFVNSDGWLK